MNVLEKNGTACGVFRINYGVKRKSFTEKNKKACSI